MNIELTLDYLSVNQIPLIPLMQLRLDPAWN